MLVNSTGASAAGCASVTAIARFNRYTNDVFLIKAGTTKELPLKVNKIYAYCGTATDTTTLEITGYAE
jgi:UDP-galactopyranose mutase